MLTKILRAGGLVAVSMAAAASPAATTFAMIAVKRPVAAVDAASIVLRARAALARPPGAVTELHTEGTLPGHGIRDASIAAKRDHPLALDFALAWAATGERPFLDQATRYLAAWAGTYRLSYNPIDETGFDALILATDLVRADLPPATRAQVDGFWRRMAEGYLAAMAGTPRNAVTNWQSHRVKLATMAAYATGDPRLIERARETFRRQVATNIRADGSVFDFRERDALHYVTYDLDPLLMAALAARAHGEDWYRWRPEGGAALADAVRWLVPYARGEKTHVEFAHSTVQFDRDRAAAGQAEYAQHVWDRGNAVQTYALAAQFDPSYAPLLAELAKMLGRRPPAWLPVAFPGRK